MQHKQREQLFNDWAQHYDDMVASNDTFPFEGYSQVLDEIVRLADVKAPVQVLDLGTGTGNLAVRFLQRGCTVFVVDFSAEMLARARTKLPQAHLIQADLLDFLDRWPSALPPKLDRIVSAYVFHEFDLMTKVRLLQQLAREHLRNGGSIVIGDVAFPTVQAREEARRRWADVWDEGGDYWVADETLAVCKQAGLQGTYHQVSSCGGVFVFALGGVG